MTTLDRYIARLFWVHFCCIGGALLTVYLVADFTVYEGSSSLLEHYKKHLPVVGLYLLPFAVFLSGVMVAARLGYTLEWAASSSAGRSASRVFRPVLLGALAISGFLIVDSRFVAGDSLVSFQPAKLHPARPRLLLESGGPVLWLSGRFGKADEAELQDVVWAARSPEGHVSSLTFGTKGQLRKETDGVYISMPEATVVSLEESARRLDTSRKGMSHRIQLPPGIADALVGEKRDDAPPLLSKPSSAVLGWTLPFVHLGVLFVGMAAVLRHAHERLFLGVAKAAVLCGSFYVLQVFIVQLCGQEYLAPAWIVAPFLVMACIGEWQMRRL